MKRTYAKAGLVMAGMLLLGTAAPAFAQSGEEDIIVTGHYGRIPDDVQSLSQPVSYADLDLSTRYGWSELRHRISLTARDLCDRLGESDSAPGPTCRDAAVRDAMDRMGTADAGYAPRDTAWVSGSGWDRSYRDDGYYRDGRYSSYAPDDRYSSTYP